MTTTTAHHPLTADEIKCIRTRGRDEDSRTSIIGLVELDALCATATSALEVLGLLDGALSRGVYIVNLDPSRDVLCCAQMAEHGGGWTIHRHGRTERAGRPYLHAAGPHAGTWHRGSVETKAARARVTFPDIFAAVAAYLRSVAPEFGR